MGDLSEPVPRSSTRVFLHIENRLLREALVRLFRKRPEVQVAGEGGSGDLTVPEVLCSNCDVLVISIGRNGLPSDSQIEAVRRAGFKILLIGMDDNEEEFLNAVRLGAAGFLLKDASASDVVGAVRAIYRGEVVCPPQFCSTLFRLVGEMLRAVTAQDLGPRPDLTLRQQQLVSLVAKGLTNKEIANRLNLSEFTVRNHIHRILKQVDAENRSEAVEAVRAHGYILNQ